MSDPTQQDPNLASGPQTDPDRDGAAVQEARNFALNEDWLATIVGLAIVVFALLGVITEGWLPL